MRVAIYIDGRNFYAGWRDAADGHRLNFEKMASWLSEQAGGTSLAGVHYFTSVAPRSDAVPDKLSGFLDLLESNAGYFVHRFQRRPGTNHCQECKTPIYFSVDKEVDTSLVTDIVMGAATNAYDICVLLTGDAEVVPAVKAVQGLGKKVFVSTWGGASLSRRLQRTTFDHIDLVGGLSTFERTAKDDEADAKAALSDPEVIDRNLDAFETELKKAEEKFEGGYVGIGYFITRWRTSSLSNLPDVRRRLLDTLVDEGRIEIYTADDGAEALRLLN
ncbi:MAG: NYN domain-containing protein [Deltaproteobacteria bacterium]|nr:NYN domain-containing protein [Deltaproteobacteria bacterium]